MLYDKQVKKVKKAIIPAAGIRFWFDSLSVLLTKEYLDPKILICLCL